jgi:hypothetical protein
MIINTYIYDNNIFMIINTYIYDNYIFIIINTYIYDNTFMIINTYIYDNYIFMIITRQILLRMRNISDRGFRENQNTHFMSNAPPGKSFVKS